MNKINLVLLLILTGAMGCSGGDGGLSANVAQLEIEKKHKQAENETLIAEREALRGETRKLADRAGEQDRVLQNERTAFEESKRNLTGEIQDLQKVLEMETSKLRSESAELALQKAAEEAEVLRLRDEGSEQRRSLEDLSAANGKLNSHVLLLRDEINQKEQAFQGGQKTWGDANDILQKQLNDMLASNQVLETKNKTLSDANAQLKASLTAEKQKLHDDVQTLTKTNLSLTQKLKDETQKGQGEAQKLSKANQDLSEKITKLEASLSLKEKDWNLVSAANSASIQSLESEIAGLKVEKQKLEQEKVALTTSLEQVSDQAQAFAVSNKDLANENAVLRASLSAEKQKLHDDIEDLRKENSALTQSLQSEVQKGQVEGNRLSQLNLDLTDEISKLNLRTTTQDASIQNLQKDVDLLKAEKKKLVSENEALTASLQQVGVQDQALASQNQSLMTENAEMRIALTAEKQKLTDELQTQTTVNLAYAQSLKEEMQKALASEIQKGQTENEKSTRLIQELTEKVGKLEASLLINRKELGALNTTSSASIQNLQEDINALKAKKQQLEQEKIALKSSLDQVGEQNQALASNNQNLLKENADLRLSLDAEKQKLHDDIERLTKANIALAQEVKDEIQKGTAASDQMSAQNRALSQQIAKFQASLVKKESDLDALNTTSSASIQNLQDNVDALKAQKQQLEQEKIALTTSLDQVGEQNQVLASNNQSLLKENADLRATLNAENEKLQNDVERLTKANIELTQTLQDEVQRGQGKADRIIEIEASIIAKEKELVALQQTSSMTIQGLQENIDSLKLAKEALEKEKDILVASIEEVRKENLGLVAANNMLEKTNETMTEANKSLSTENQSLMTQNSELRASLEKREQELLADIKILGEDKQKLNDYAEELKKSLSSEQSTHAEASKDFVVVKLGLLDDLDKLQKSLALAKQEAKLEREQSWQTIQDLQSNVDTLEQEKLALQNEKVLAKDSIKKFETTIANLKIDSKKQKTENEALAAEKETLERDNAELRDRLKDEKQALEKLNATLEKSNNALKLEIRDLTAAVQTEKESTLAKSDEWIGLEKELNERIRKLQDDLVAAKEREKLQARVDSSNASIPELHSDIESLRKEKQSLSTENELLTASVSGLRSDVARLQDEGKKQLSEIESLKLSNSKWESEMRKVTDPHELFKMESTKYLYSLKPNQSRFGSVENVDLEDFKQKLAELADPELLFSPPMGDWDRLQNGHFRQVALEPVFEYAPRPTTGFSVFIPYAHGEGAAEDKAKFLLATDDKELLERLLTERDIHQDEKLEFKVPADYPIIYLGRGMFMLPKRLLNSLADTEYEEEIPKIFVMLRYDLDTTTDPLPRGYGEYVRNRDARKELHENARRRAAEKKERYLAEQPRDRVK